MSKQEGNDNSSLLPHLFGETLEKQKAGDTLVSLDAWQMKSI